MVDGNRTRVKSLCERQGTVAIAVTYHKLGVPDGIQTHISALRTQPPESLADRDKIVAATTAALLRCSIQSRKQQKLDLRTGATDGS